MFCDEGARKISVGLVHTAVEDGHRHALASEALGVRDVTPINGRLSLSVARPPASTSIRDTSGSEESRRSPRGVMSPGIPAERPSRAHFSTQACVCKPLRSSHAPVAQWIEQRFPKPRAHVRFMPGASLPALLSCHPPVLVVGCIDRDDGAFARGDAARAAPRSCCPFERRL
jgi:hypothetical protein